MTPEIQANVDYMKESVAKGKEFIFKSELSHPSKLVYTTKHFPVLAVQQGRILFYSNDFYS